MSAKVLTFPNYNDAASLQRTYLLPLNKLDATSAPGTSNDDTQGYVAGSIWADRTNDKIYHCTDNATGAATWVEAGSGGGGGSGTVTSVAMTVPTGFSVSGSPVTTSGTLAVTADSQAANLVYASPASGGAAAPAFRALVTDDLADGIVTKAKIEDASEACLLGRGLGSGAGDVQEITLGSGITMSGTSLIADTSVVQPLDATLTALAGQNWAANAMPVGTGVDTVTQLALAANTFPARSSAGDVAAKDITDFGLSLVDDANAAAGRTTLGGTTVGQNYFTLTNPSAVTFPRMNADNTVTALNASDFRTAIGAGSGGGDALTSNPLSQFASTTSSQLAGVISDEIGTGSLVFASAIADKFISGFNLLYSSTNVVKVEPGTCRANSGSTLITLSSRTSVAVDSNAIINGNDSFQGYGTASANSGNATITGSSSAFFTDFGTRALTGTVSSSGATVTGTGTLFMSELWIGCLLGNSTRGYFQVTAIASDTSLTLVSTPGAAFSSEAVNAIENPTIKVGTNTAVQVKSIESNTSLTIVANSSATVSGQLYRIGVPPTTTTYPASNNFHMNLWACSGAGGTGCFASTQRTTPFGIANYNTSFRRIGSVLLNAGSVQGFSQWGSSNDRWVQYEITRNTVGLRVLSAGTATSWTAVYCGGVAPPLLKAVNFNANVASITGYAAYFRARNAGDSATSRSLSVTCTAVGGTSDCFLAACDGAGYVDYVNGHASLTAYLDVIGYTETL